MEQLSTKEIEKKYYVFKKTFLILFIAYFTIGLCTNGFFSILPFVSKEFYLSKLQLGYYSTFHCLSATLLAIFSGNIVDKIGSKSSIVLGMSFIGITLFSYSLSDSYQIILVLALFSGLGLSFITPSLVKGITKVAPQEKQAFFLGLVQSGNSVGSIVGPATLPVFALSFGWRISIQITAIFTMLVGLLTYYLYPDRTIKNNNMNFTLNKSFIQKKTDGKINGLSFQKSLSGILINKPLLFICILGIVFGITEGSVFSHFTIFLTEDMDLNHIIAGIGFSILFIGGVTGMAGFGWLSDRLFKKNRQLFLFLISLFSGIMFLIFSFLSHNPQINQLTIIFCIFFLGLASIGWPGAYFVLVKELANDKYTGVATGISLFFIRIGILLAPIGFGYIADLNSNYRYSWLFFGLLITFMSTLFLFHGYTNKDMHRLNDMNK